MGFYSGQTLLSKMDLFNRRPELYISTTNRSAGKTTFFHSFLIRKYKSGQGKFGLFYRYNYELSEVADKFFKEIQGLYFHADTLEAVPHAMGKFSELLLNGQSCGYAMALNDADALRKYSHYFSDVDRIFFDEFQSESGHYCPREIKKFLSLHTSVARGGGKSRRYVPVYMAGNAVTLLNPYFIALGISTRIQKDTKFMRGNGFVLEHGFNEDAANAQKESGIMRAFAGDEYVSYSTENVYLDDNLTFLESPPNNEQPRYMYTLRYKRNDYGVRMYPKNGIIYVSDKSDQTAPYKIAITNDDMQTNYVMLKLCKPHLADLNYYYMHGACRFKNLLCKESLMTALSL